MEGFKKIAICLLSIVMLKIKWELILNSEICIVCMLYCSGTVVIAMM